MPADLDIMMPQPAGHDAQLLFRRGALDNQQILGQELAKAAVDFEEGADACRPSSQSALIDPFLHRDMRRSFESDITDTEAYMDSSIDRMQRTWELFCEMQVRDIVPDESLFRELRDRFGSPYGFGEYFRGGMGADAVRDLLDQVDLEAEAEKLDIEVKTAKGQKQARAVKRLKVVSAFLDKMTGVESDDDEGDEDAG